MSKSFFNSVNLDGESLQRATARALGQNDLVARIFEANPHRKFSPSQLKELIARKFDRYSPLTSWRRSVTTLTKEGFLVKLDEQVPGAYGEPEHLWQLRKYDEEGLSRFMEDFQDGKLETEETRQWLQAQLF